MSDPKHPELLDAQRAREPEHARLGERLRPPEELEALGTLGGGVAHDLDHVLAAIRGRADARLGELPPGAPVREDAVHVAAAGEPGREPARAAAPSLRRILLVDDDPPVARALARMLATLGYDVTTEGTAEDALERFRATPADFDAVITDQTLPRMGGDELTLALLALRPELPVLICTGYSERVDEVQARAIGARALLPKPLALSELGEALAAALAGP